MTGRKSPSGASLGATDVQYSPSTPGDWDPVPTEVGAALDQAKSGGGGVNISMRWAAYGGGVEGNPVTTIFLLNREMFPFDNGASTDRITIAADSGIMVPGELGDGNEVSGTLVIGLLDFMENGSPTIIPPTGDPWVWSVWYSTDTGMTPYIKLDQEVTVAVDFNGTVRLPFSGAPSGASIIPVLTTDNYSQDTNADRVVLVNLEL